MTWPDFRPRGAGYLTNGLPAVARLAIPIIAANLTQPLLSAVDSAIAGHMPEPRDLAGVALGAVVFNLIYWGLIFLKQSTTSLVAQAFGAGDPDQLRSTVIRSLALALGIGLVLLGIGTPLLCGIVGLLEPTPAVSDTALRYGLARSWSIPAALGNYVVLGYLLGCQRPRAALSIQLLINGVNLVAALAGVYVLNAGVAGLGAATAVADYSGFALGLYFLWPVLRTGGKLTDRLRVYRVKPLAAMNLSLLVRTAALLAVVFSFSRQGARQGAVILAANGLLLNFQALMTYCLDGFSQASQVLAGTALGGSDRGALRTVVVSSTLLSLLVAASFSALYWLLGPDIIRALTDQSAVRAAAIHCLPWLALLPLVALWGFQFDGLFIGAARGYDVMVAMLLACVIYFSVSPVLSRRYENDGLWCAMLLFMATRGIALAARLPGLLAVRAGKQDLWMTV